MACVCEMRLGWEERWFRTGSGVTMLSFVGHLGVVEDPAGCGKALVGFRRTLWMAWEWGRRLPVYGGRE
jgi:hypothetical protein